MLYDEMLDYLAQYENCKIAQLLKGIDDKKFPLELDPRPKEDWYYGYPVFRCNGYTIQIFTRGFWKYIDHIITPEGKQIESFSSVKLPEEERTFQEMLINWYYPKDPTYWGFNADGVIPGFE